MQTFQKLDVFPVVLRNDDVKILSTIEDPSLEGIILSPGPGAPPSTGLCLDVLKKIPAHMPVFGVCLGHQILGYFAGYEICRAKHIMHGKTSHITHENHFLFKDIENPFIATRYHSLVISSPRVKNPIPIDVLARSEDGEIMAIAYKDRPWFGVQFHPESILTPAGPRIIKNFIENVVCIRGQNNPLKPQKIKKK